MTWDKGRSIPPRTNLVNITSHPINCLSNLDKTYGELEEASTHKSAKIHAGNVFVTRDLDLWPQNKLILTLIVEHLYVKFSFSRIDFWDTVRKIRQTDKRM